MEVGGWLGLVILILDIAMIFRVIRDKPAGAGWWVLLIILLPVFGPLIYIGTRTRHPPQPHQPT